MPLPSVPPTRNDPLPSIVAANRYGRSLMTPTKSTTNVSGSFPLRFAPYGLPSFTNCPLTRTTSPPPLQPVKSTATTQLEAMRKPRMLSSLIRIIRVIGASMTLSIGIQQLIIIGQHHRQRIGAVFDAADAAITNQKQSRTRMRPAPAVA